MAAALSSDVRKKMQRGGKQAVRQGRKVEGAELHLRQRRKNVQDAAMRCMLMQRAAGRAERAARSASGS